MYIKSTLLWKTLLQTLVVTLVEFKNVVVMPYLPPEGNGKQTVHFSVYIPFLKIKSLFTDLV